MLLKHLRTAIIALVLSTVLTGLFYPVLVTTLAQLFFPGKANGNMIVKNGKSCGSKLIGQPFSNPKYFWSRISATGPYAFNGGASAGSNYGPLHPALFDAVHKRIQDLKKVDSLNQLPIPVDLVTSSSSGLDPHISIAAVSYQAARVARSRKMSEQQVRALINQYIEGRMFGFLGEPRVNVLQLNLALDEYQKLSGE